jgi:hypothetical protein
VHPEKSPLGWPSSGTVLYITSKTPTSDKESPPFELPTFHLRERYLQAIEHPQALGGDLSAIQHNVKNELDGLVPFIITFELLERSKRTIELLRETVFKRVTRGRRAIVRGTSPRLLSALLLEEAFSLNRLRLEFEQQEHWISRRSASWQQYKYKSARNHESDLNTDSRDGIKRTFNTLSAHLQLARTWCTEYFTGRNTQAIFALTTAAVILAFIQAISSDFLRRLVAAVIENWRVFLFN